MFKEPYVYMTIGEDISQQDIDELGRFPELEELSGYRFDCYKAEDLLPEVLSYHPTFLDNLEARVKVTGVKPLTLLISLQSFWDIIKDVINRTFPAGSRARNSFCPAIENIQTQIYQNQTGYGLDLDILVDISDWI